MNDESLPTRCCSPARSGEASSIVPPTLPDHGSNVAGLVRIAGGEVIHGTSSARAVPGDGEGPPRRIQLSAFHISPTVVTVSEFDEFIAATGHVTTAEVEGWSFVMHAHVPVDAHVRGHASGTPWWLGVDGSSWNAPYGPGSYAEPDHPVVHVSVKDALAYCAWRRVRLPTEVEWEHAARGGTAGHDFPWGDDESNIWLRANVWRGDFPASDLGVTNGTCRADAFEPNGFGLHNMVGNVWEWTSSSWGTGTVEIVARGGSYLCHASYCRRYRVTARSRQFADSSAGNLGFRVAARA